MNKAFAVSAAVFITISLGGCAGRPYGNLIAVSASAPGASAVDMLVATTRSDNDVPPGVMFSGERARGLAFADICVSIPPDGARRVGEVQWPSSIPGDPARDFVTLRADRLDQKQAVAAFDERLRNGPSRHVLLFVHGYNTRFEEAVYRFAQVVHDSGAPVVPVLFTWPSRGKLFDYAYDRESATYSRDALEAVLQDMVADKNVASISILAHSMGNFVAIEALRQMVIRDRSLSPKIADIMMASPDIDVDVFRREIAEIEPAHKKAPVFLFVSQDDRALFVSGQLAGGEPRLGAIDPTAEPYRSILEEAGVHPIDLTNIESDDFLRHGKFAQSEVVKLIGVRLAAADQTLTDAKPTMGERIGGVMQGAAGTMGAAATLAISAPASIFDPNTRDTLGDQAASVGASMESAIRSPVVRGTQ